MKYNKLAHKWRGFRFWPRKTAYKLVKKAKSGLKRPKTADTSASSPETSDGEDRPSKIKMAEIRKELRAAGNAKAAKPRRCERRRSTTAEVVHEDAAAEEAAGSWIIWILKFALVLQCLLCDGDALTSLIPTSSKTDLGQIMQYSEIVTRPDSKFIAENNYDLINETQAKIDLVNQLQKEKLASEALNQIQYDLGQLGPKIER